MKELTYYEISLLLNNDATEVFQVASELSKDLTLENLQTTFNQSNDKYQAIIKTTMVDITKDKFDNGDKKLKVIGVYCKDSTLEDITNLENLVNERLYDIVIDLNN